MAKYTSWEDLIKSKDILLQAYPSKFYIERGIFYFDILSDGVTYTCEGSSYSVNDLYFNADCICLNQLDFDSFYMIEVGNESNVICKW